MGILEKIAEIEREISRTQKNKATEYHLGLLKAKLAKYRQQLLEPGGKSASKGEGFDVMKSGDARVALIGFPSVGKSTLLSTLTKTKSECAAYEFTTLTCIPGVIEHNGAKIQLLDLPGIIEGASQGKGRGRQVIAVARTADVVVMMLDATKSKIQKELLTAELESVGIRLNKRRPNIYFKQKKGGGISFNSTLPLTKVNEKLVQMILHEWKIFNAEVLFREDCTSDEFVDVILGNRVYMPCLYVYNKIDQISIEEVDRLAREPSSVVVSCNMRLNLDYLVEMIWEYLALVRVYTKKRGERPDFDGGLILRKGCTAEHVCHAIHRSDVISRTVKIVRQGRIQTLITLPQGWHPWRLCCTRSGDILVSMCTPERSHFKIVRFQGQTATQEIDKDERGQHIFRGGKYGVLVEENNNGDICTSDMNAKTVIVMDKTGRVRFRYTGIPARRNKPFQPVHIATDSLSQIIISDIDNDCLHILDQDGQFLRCVDNCGLLGPFGLSVDREERLWVGLYDTGDVKVIQYME